MTITVDTVILDIMGALQTLASGVSGVVAPQPAVYPTALDTMSGQTFVMTVLRSGEGWQKGAGYSQGIYIFDVLVFLDPVAQSDIPSHVVDGALLYHQLMNVFVKSTNTPLFNPGPYQATIQSGMDGSHISGPGPNPSLRFRGVDYYGFDMSVPVRWQAVQV